MRNFAGPGGVEREKIQGKSPGRKKGPKVSSIIKTETAADKDYIILMSGGIILGKSGPPGNLEGRRKGHPLE